MTIAERISADTSCAFSHFGQTSSWLPHPCAFHGRGFFFVEERYIVPLQLASTRFGRSLDSGTHVSPTTVPPSLEGSSPGGIVLFVRAPGCARLSLRKEAPATCGVYS